MKKAVFVLTVLTVGISSESFASKGYASDGLMLMMAVAGFLLVVAAILKVTDYLRMNGRTLIHASVTWIRQKITYLRDHLKKTKSAHFGFSH